MNTTTLEMHRCTRHQSSASQLTMDDIPSVAPSSTLCPSFKALGQQSTETCPSFPDSTQLLTGLYFQPGNPASCKYSCDYSQSSVQYEQKLNMLKSCNLLILVIGVITPGLITRQLCSLTSLLQGLEEWREKTGDILSFLVQSGSFTECKCTSERADSLPVLLNMGYVLPGGSRQVTTFLWSENEISQFHDPGSHTKSVGPLLEYLNQQIHNTYDSTSY